MLYECVVFRRLGDRMWMWQIRRIGEVAIESGGEEPTRLEARWKGRKALRYYRTPKPPEVVR